MLQYSGWRYAPFTVLCTAIKSREEEEIPEAHGDQCGNVYNSTGSLQFCLISISLHNHRRTSVFFGCHCKVSLCLLTCNEQVYLVSVMVRAKR